ncbi:MAG: hypothetical protein M3066_17505 [Actinomycetota bacterium]|nr:hypothetical protein [Actinomycetota bacterium]
MTRFGGDEFVVVAEGPGTSPRASPTVCERLSHHAAGWATTMSPSPPAWAWPSDLLATAWGPSCTTAGWRSRRPRRAAGTVRSSSPRTSASAPTVAVRSKPTSGGRWSATSSRSGSSPSCPSPTSPWWAPRPSSGGNIPSAERSARWSSSRSPKKPA